MSESTVTLRQADGDSMAYVERLLAQADLPTEDLGGTHSRFYVARTNGSRVAVGGLEVYGTVALLRSIAVEPERRGSGYGRAIVNALEAEARSAGVETLYLLTTTAATFFDGLGYTEISREEPPPQIQETTQFSDRCPTAAVPMRKSP